MVTQFCDWWVHVLKWPPIKPGHVLPVCHALQGHPELPQLWAKLIHKILNNLGFTRTSHEPCLYTGKIYGETLFLLRQIDNFAVSTPRQNLCNKLFTNIQTHLTQPLKLLRLLTMYNELKPRSTTNSSSSSAQRTSNRSWREKVAIVRCILTC